MVAAAAVWTAVWTAAIDSSFWKLVLLIMPPQERAQRSLILVLSEE
jgi:hypothetical protein